MISHETSAEQTEQNQNKKRTECPAVTTVCE